MGQHLERNVSIEPGVASPINLPHATFADLRGDFVRAEARAWGEGQTRWIIRVERQRSRDFSSRHKAAPGQPV
jgi:hypothetical protein